MSLQQTKTRYNPQGGLSAKQREILEKRKKIQQGKLFSYTGIILCGMLLCITIIGIPLGFILILIGSHGNNNITKEITEIDFRLASE